jgi:hypothetical protein
MLTAAAVSKGAVRDVSRRIEVVGVEQKRSVYSTSFAVDDVTVTSRMVTRRT